MADLVTTAGEDDGVITRLEDRAASAGHRVDLVDLADDPTAWVGRCGQVHFVEPEQTTVENGSPVHQLAPLDQTFALQSRPDSTRVIYLDFDGQTVTGSYSNEVYTHGAPIVADPFSLDADLSIDFSDGELTQIQNIWDAVAEDFAPFDVNVTTQDPGTAGIVRTSTGDTHYGSRALITQGGPVESSCRCAGFATLGTFDSVQEREYTQPVWVFRSGSAVYDAQVVSHEVAHNFGLEHHGTSTSEYYSGAGSWTPIMGGGAARRLSQWSSGEYADADNPFQDDMALLAAKAPVVTDDHAATGAGVPTSLTAGVPAAGVISTRSDQDSFSFTAAGGIALSVTSSSSLPNLDPSVTIQDATGATVGRLEPTVPTDGSSGSGVAWSGALPPGHYTATVDGVGSGDPAMDGRYSDYASVGRYAIAVDATASTPSPAGLPAGEQPVGPTAPRRVQNLRVVVSGDKVVVTWSAGSTPQRRRVTRYLLDLDRGRDRAATRGRTVLKDVKRGHRRIRIAAQNAAGTSAYSRWIRFRVG